MKLIYTSKGEKIKVDEDDYERLKGIGWFVSERGYVTGYLNGKNVKMHRIIMGNPSLEVDHINREKLDNRKANLRTCTRAQNAFNRVNKKKSATGTVGVYKNVYRNKIYSYRAEIKYFGNRLHLGSFKTKELASIAYKEASKKYHGEFSPILGTVDGTKLD